MNLLRNTPGLNRQSENVPTERQRSMSGNRTQFSNQAQNAYPTNTSLANDLYENPMELHHAPSVHSETGSLANYTDAYTERGNQLYEHQPLPSPLNPHSLAAYGMIEHGNAEYDQAQAEAENERRARAYAEMSAAVRNAVLFRMAGLTWRIA